MQPSQLTQAEEEMLDLLIFGYIRPETAKKANPKPAEPTKEQATLDAIINQIR